MRGQKLTNPPEGVRPTTSRLREALFNVLGDVQGTVWVEAFAGTGAVGIEALSRGAELVIFNERERSILQVLESNFEKCGLETGCEVHRGDAFVFFQRLVGRPVDVVFLDPPYRFGRYSKLLKKIKEALAEGAPGHVVLMEVFKKTEDEVVGPHYRVVRRLRAGDSHLLILKPVYKPF